ncbi:MAG TPA: exo-beta-N-acetylmuramidase NamZ domain-containing protein, partial [Ignavibacteriaceae bacterium]|nr:exo-beta-N-acetylmuramidase NamZ domain-containing protein [Ignavibacteriaceae bacterium]
DLKGNIYETRPINYPGDTNTDYDVRGHALICVMGNYEVQKFNKEQMKAVVELTSFLTKRYNVLPNEIKAHKDYASTLCPGEDFYRFIRDNTIQKLVAQKLAGLEINYDEIFRTGPVVKTGIEVLRERNFDILKGKRIGLVTNQTGVDSKLKSTIDILFDAPDINLVALFGPEHGVRGNYAGGDYVEFYIDDYTKLPVYSLYGKTHKPDSTMLKDIDLLVYDIQDIGIRSYTYISTMGLIMEAASENNIEVVVLDRPNPLGGKKVEGGLVEDGHFSFVSMFKIPYVYGLTCGELATLINEEGMLRGGVKCKLKVVQMEGWNRGMYFEETKLPWIPTSPHIPNMFSPFYCTSSGIVGELNAISIGVGYTLPFQTFAAEWFDSKKLTEKMNSYKIDGVIFRPITYKPFYAIGMGKNLHGVEIHFTDYKNAELMPIQFYLIHALKELYPDSTLFKNENKSRFKMFDNVIGNSRIREILNRDFSMDELQPYFEKDATEFREFSKKYFLYK